MFRFAVMGCGNIARSFCDAVNRVPGACLAACASTSKERADALAEKYNIPRAYTDYAEMLEKEKPDCAYIATLPANHYDLTMLALAHHVPVLCEKAMFMNSRDAEAVFNVSEKQGIFTMEAMWSRFLPPIVKACEWVREGKIGAIASAEMMIGFIPPSGKELHRCVDPAKGGGAAFDITVYALEVLQHVLGEDPISWKVMAMRGETGVDLVDGALVRFPSTLAVLHTSLGGPMEERMVLYGTGGRVVVPIPHHCSEAYLYNENGKLLEHFKDTVTENGFTYEICEVMRCVKAGLAESPMVPHKDTLLCSRMFDDIDRSMKEDN